MSDTVNIYEESVADAIRRLWKESKPTLALPRPDSEIECLLLDIAPLDARIVRKKELLARESDAEVTGYLQEDLDEAVADKAAKESKLKVLRAREALPKIPKGTRVRVSAQDPFWTYGGCGELSIGNEGVISDYHRRPDGTQLVIFSGPRVDIVDGSWYTIDPDDEDDKGISLFYPRDCLEVVP